VAGNKSRRQTARALNADAGMLPGNKTMDQTGTGKGTGMATNAAIHVRGRQDIHRHCSIGRKKRILTDKEYQVWR
jgi:hypothetical protein